jgi:hypothetical protein
LGLGAEGGLGEGRATDVAEADEEDGGHVAFRSSALRGVA